MSEQGFIAKSSRPLLWRPHEATPRQRIAWIDAAKGIGIVLVVIGHVEAGLASAHMMEGPAWTWFYYGLYTFHMPLFFVLAGLHVPRELARGTSRFLRDKLVRLAYPYVLWSLVQGVLMMELSSSTNSTVGLGDLLGVGWRPMWQFWFLYALSLCHLAVAVAGLRRPVLVSLAVASMLLSLYLPGGIATQTLHSLTFFVAGILLSPRWLARPPGPSGTVAAAMYAVLAMILLPMTIYVAGREVGGQSYMALTGLPASASGLWDLPPAAIGIAAVVLIARILKGPVLRGFVVLGNVSMTIFVLHIIAASGMRIIMTKLGVPQDPLLYLIVCTTVGIAVPTFTHFTLERLHLLSALGLAAMRRRQPVAPATA